MPSARELLRSRQAISRSEFVGRDRCDCNNQTLPSTFNGLSGSGGTAATVREGTRVVPVKIQSNGWINPTQAVPIVVSGGVKYVFSMPQGG